MPARHIISLNGWETEQVLKLVKKIRLRQEKEYQKELLDKFIKKPAKGARSG